MTDGRGAAAEWRANWRAVLAGTLGVATIVLHIYTFGTFLTPIVAATGWTRAAVSSGFTVLSIISILAAPVVGIFVDRHGTRALALPGMLIYGSGFASLALTNGSLALWWGSWAWIALGFSMAGTYVWSKLVSLLFDRSRGLAIAIVFCGGGLTLIISPVVAEALIASLGWRAAYVVLAAIWTVSAVLATATLPRRLTAVASTPYHAGPASSGPKDSSAVSALRTRVFYLLMVSGALINSSIVALTIHFVPLLTGRGVSHYHAALIAGSIGVTSIMGRLIAGTLVDRFQGNLVGAAIFGLPALSCLLLLWSPISTGSALTAALILGAAFGAEFDILAFLVGRHFGLRNYTTIFGLMFAGFSVFAGIAPPLVGWSFDRFGSYNFALIALMPAFILSSLLIGATGRYPARGPSV